MQKKNKKIKRLNSFAFQTLKLRESICHFKEQTENPTPFVPMERDQACICPQYFWSQIPIDTASLGNLSFSITLLPHLRRTRRKPRFFSWCVDVQLSLISWQRWVSIVRTLGKHWGFPPSPSPFIWSLRPQILLQTHESATLLHHQYRMHFSKLGFYIRAEPKRLDHFPRLCPLRNTTSNTCYMRELLTRMQHCQALPCLTTCCSCQKEEGSDTCGTWSPPRACCEWSASASSSCPASWKAYHKHHTEIGGWRACASACGAACCAWLSTSSGRWGTCCQPEPPPGVPSPRLRKAIAAAGGTSCTCWESRPHLTSDHWLRHYHHLGFVGGEQEKKEERKHEEAI